MGDFPPTWYKYEFPLPEVPGAPVPSVADYRPTTCAWLIEMFAAVLGKDYHDLILRYENNTPHNKNDDIYVKHPGDKLYWPDHNTCVLKKSPELEHYEKYAQKSARLKLFEENSPAKIRYFQKIPC
jgi:hypothetical protein